MPHPSSPLDYALIHLRELHERWPAVRDADVEAVHDARVATRRLRAALPFVASASKDTRKRVRRIGRALGRVRELDVTYALLNTLESRVENASTAIGLVRLDVRARLDRERRRMIKTLDLPPRSIARAIAGGGRWTRIASIWRDWPQAVRDAIVWRADDAVRAVRHATAVYMPNRSHKARIALKKLRYTVELAIANGLLAEEAVLLETVKEVQDILGDLHDLHVVTKLFEAIDVPADVVREAAIVASVVAGETARVHQKYVRRRDDLCSAIARYRECAAAREASAARVAMMAIPAAVLVALPIAGLFAGDRKMRELERVDIDDETRIPRRAPLTGAHRPVVRPAGLATR